MRRIFNSSVRARVDGCEWQGLYGDAAKHLAECCSACKPDQLLKRLEDCEEKLAAALVRIDDLKAENRSLELEKVEANKRAAEKLLLEAEMVVMQRELDQRANDIANLRAQGKDWGEEKSRLLVDVARLEAQARSLQEQGDLASVRLAQGASDLQKAQAKLRGRNRSIWSLEEKLRKAKRGRGSRRDSSPKRRRRHSSSARGSNQSASTSRAMVDLDETPAPWNTGGKDGASPLMKWNTGKGQFF